MKKDLNLSQLAKSKHEVSKRAMGPMMHAVEVLANSNKHIKADKNQTVVGTKYTEVTDWYTFFKADFPTIITDTAEYPLWKIQEILIEYFEWVFDESEADLALKQNLSVELDKFRLS